MKIINNVFVKRSRIKGWILVLLLVLGFVIGWYIVVRIVSPWQVIKQFELETIRKVDYLPAETPKTLRVGCYNIAHGRGGELGLTNWQGGSLTEKTDRIKQIAQLIKDADLDIVVLNEADFSSFWSGHIDQAKRIARQAGYRYLVEQRNIDVAIPFVRLQFGNAILSRLPITDAVFLDYPHPSRLQEMLCGGFKDGVIATIALGNNESIQAVAVHLSLEGEKYRCESIQMIMNLQQQSSLPMIAMGDFNSTAEGLPGYSTSPEDQNAIEILLASERWSARMEKIIPNPVNPKDRISREYLENQNDYTFPSEEPVRVIDWIFTTSPWKVNNKNVIQSDLSDHLPVTAVLSRN